MPLIKSNTLAGTPFQSPRHSLTVSSLDSLILLIFLGSMEALIVGWDAMIAAVSSIPAPILVSVKRTRGELVSLGASFRLLLPLEDSSFEASASSTLAWFLLRGAATDTGAFFFSLGLASPEPTVGRPRGEGPVDISRCTRGSSDRQRY